MKRIATIAIAALMAFAGTQTAWAWGQKFGIDFGVKGGLNHAKLDFDCANGGNYNELFNVHGGTGFFVGPAMKINLPPCFGVDGAVFYDQKNTYLNDEKIKFHSILIPINARLNIPFTKGFGVFAAVGPQFAFNLGDSDYSWENVQDTFKWKKSAFSINLGAGVMLADHIELGFTYNIPLGSTGDADFKSAWNTVTDKETYKSKTNSWTLSAFLYF